MGLQARGSHRFICDRCRLEYRSNEKRKEWNGAVVCRSCFEPRHELDFYRIPKEDTSVPDPRPEPSVAYVSVDEAYPVFTLTDEFGTPIVTETSEYIQVPIGII